MQVRFFTYKLIKPFVHFECFCKYFWFNFSLPQMIALCLGLLWVRLLQLGEDGRWSSVIKKFSTVFSSSSPSVWVKKNTSPLPQALCYKVSTGEHEHLGLPLHHWGVPSSNEGTTPLYWSESSFDVSWSLGSSYDYRSVGRGILWTFPVIAKELLFQVTKVKAILLLAKESWVLCAHGNINYSIV